MARQQTACATAVIWVLVAAFVVIPVTTWAQEPVKAFDLLSTRLKPGDTIWTTDANEREISGTIGAGIGPAAELVTDAQRPFGAASIARAVGAELRLQAAMRGQGSAATVRKRHRVRNGVLIGAGVGALAGGLLTLASGDDCGGGPDYGGGCAQVGALAAGPVFVVGAMAGAVIGAGIGLVVGLLTR